VPLPATTPPQNPIHCLIVSGQTSTLTAPKGTVTRLDTGATLASESATPILDAAAALRTAHVDPSTLILIAGPSGDPALNAQLVDININPRAGNGQ
jgi:carbohydrate-binding DOMON domain-containing protein